jgi:NADH-quinone oxidoreductase subunit M
MFLSSLGLPLLNGFVGEFTILQAAFMANPYWAAWAVPGVVLAAAYLLWLYQRVFFGKVENPKNEKLLDLSPRELATFLPLVAVAFWIGLYPKPFFQILDQPVTALVQQIDHPRLYNAQQLQKPRVDIQSASPQIAKLTTGSASPETGR